MLGAAEIRHELGVGYQTLSWVLLAAPLALSLLIETPLLLRSDRWPKRRAIAWALAAIAALCAIAARTRSPWLLMATLSLWGSAAGVAVGVSRGALMNAFPEDRERAMARWALLGAIGDAAAPILTLGVAAIGGSWRTTLLAFAAVVGIHAVVVAMSPLPEPKVGARDPEEPEAPPRTFARGLRNRALLTWLAAESLCCLLDEILVAFGTLRLREDFGASAAQQGAAFVLFAVGGSLGLLLTERWLARFAPRRVLVAASASCLVAYVGWIEARFLPLSIALAFVVGALAAPLYPITAARAHRACPGEPGLVGAVGQLFTVLEVAAPVAVGVVADRFGIRAALYVLALEPVGILLIALGARGRR